LQREGNFRGESQPFQPNPAEQQAAERLSKPPPGEQRQSGEQEIDPHQSWNFLMEMQDGIAQLEWKSKTGKPERNIREVIDRMLSIMNQQTPPEGRISFGRRFREIPNWPEDPFRFGVNKENLEKFIQEQKEIKHEDTPPER
jgi:hypothetical protein